MLIHSLISKVFCSSGTQGDQEAPEWIMFFVLLYQILLSLLEIEESKQKQRRGQMATTNNVPAYPL